jgi:hypothetical protein
MTTATFAQHTARQQSRRRTAERILSADVAGNDRQARLFELNAELRSLYTSQLDQQDTNEKMFEWVDGNPAPVATLIARMDAEIKRREQASYEYQTEDGIYGSDYETEIIY